MADRRRSDGRKIPDTVSITITEREALMLLDLLKYVTHDEFIHVSALLEMKIDRLARMKAKV